ncbi:MAG TPA: MarR family transcriptional regulator [Roseateles sp.]|nr:MarR family transcriptional regulator [Roseateles sp.]
MSTSTPHVRQHIGALIGQIGRQWRRAIDRHLQPYGLTEATWLPLLHVARAAAPMRQKELAASLSLDGSSVVRLLDTLETAGLVERREQGSDRRAKAILLTPLGRQTVQQVEQSVAEVREAALAGLGDAELIVTQATLQHILQALQPAAADAALP